MLKVGDKVQIRPDLKRKQEYFGIVPKMEKMAGKHTTIRKICGEQIYLADDLNSFMWHESWLIPEKLSTAVKMFIEE